MNQRKRKRKTSLKGLSRPGKQLKQLTLEECTTPEVFEKVVALLKALKTTPSELNIHGIALMTRLSYQDLHNWYFEQSQIQPAATSTPSASTSESTDELHVLLDKAAKAMPIRRPHCLEKKNHCLEKKKITARQRRAKRCKDWDPARKYSCTSGCGQNFKKKCDWERHENGNRPQEAWLCNHGPTWKDRCSFCNQNCPD